MRRTRASGTAGTVGLALIALVSIAGCDDAEICEAGALEAALGVASAGDVVTVGACEVLGEFTVPAGVTLRGAGAGATTLRVGEGGRALTLEAAPVGSASPTTVEALRVVSDGCAAVVADGPGAVTVHDLTIEASRGVGFAAQGVTALVVDRVDVVGAIDPSALPSSIPLPPYTCATATTATHGVVVVDTTDAHFTDVSARNFAAFGALFVDTTVSWAGGAIEDNVGTGLEIWGGEGELDGVRLCRARQGTLLVESYNGLFAAGASVHSNGLAVCESEAFGLMHAGATGLHEDLSVTDNAFAGVWAQDSAALTLRGTATMLSGNGFAGVATIRTPTVSIANARIEGTDTRTSLVGATGSIRAGDGVHLVGAEEVTLDGLSLPDNDRVGLLLDFAGGAPTTLAVTAVEVNGAGAAFGALAQNGAVPDGWDADVTRLGMTLANDADFDGALDIVEAIGPSCLPDPSALATGGLGELVGR